MTRVRKRVRSREVKLSKYLEALNRYPETIKNNGSRKSLNISFRTTGVRPACPTTTSRMVMPLTMSMTLSRGVLTVVAEVNSAAVVAEEASEACMGWPQPPSI